jgi:hypothetical protein
MLSADKFSLIVNHDDAEREFAYTSAAEASFAKAKELGWMVISMKDDWKTVFQGGRQLYASHLVLLPALCPRDRKCELRCAPYLQPLSVHPSPRTDEIERGDGCPHDSKQKPADQRRKHPDCLPAHGKLI